MAGVRWATVLLCCLFLAVTFAGAGAPLFATDLKQPRQSGPSEEEQAEKLADFCYGQRQICRKICRLRFRDDDVGCPQSCDSRVSRCDKTGCYKWLEPEFLIAERFGGYRCAQ